MTLQKWVEGGTVAEPESRIARVSGAHSVVIRLLSFSAEVVSNNAEVLRGLISLYPTASFDSAPYRLHVLPSFRVIESPGANDSTSFAVSSSERDDACFNCLPPALEEVEYRLTGAAVKALSNYLFVHAGVVANGRVGLILPGGSGAGKSTLVAALCLRGYSYLSDELAILEPDSPMLHPFPRALRMRGDGLRALENIVDLTRSNFVRLQSGAGENRYVVLRRALPSQQSVPTRYIVFPRRQPGERGLLVAMGRAKAVGELARHSLNLPKHGTAGVETLARVVEGADCYTLLYERVEEGMRAIAELSGMDQSPLATGRPA